MRSLAAALAAVHLLAAGGAAAAPAPAAWSSARHLPGVVDLTTPRSDGALVVSGGSRLLLLDRASGAMTPFAAGPGGYPGGAGDEPYLALSSGRTVAAAGCGFAPDDLFVLQQRPRDIIRIDPGGHAHTFVHIDGVDSLNGIAFDTVGRFGNRLLAIGPSRGATVVVAIDCRGRIEHITDRGPAMEGGMAVAPAGFGAFGGDLVAADEYSGQILAIRPDGSSALVAHPNLPTGADTGVEGVGFVPPGFSAGGTAYFSDRATPGNAHPGTDSLLEIDARRLVAAGVRDGDLLAATEGGALTAAVRCAASCSVTEVLTGPPTAHGEGHLVAVADHPGPAGASLPVASDLGAAARTQAVLTFVATCVAVVLLLVVVAVVVRWRLARRRRERAGGDPTSTG
jgi:hypothetical protein